MKTKSFLSILSILLFFCLLTFAKESQAAGSATVSWVPPTTDEGGGALTGLAGYKVYYDTASHWASSCPTNVGTMQNVPGGSATKYYFNNTLTPGSTYYFAVMAFDEASPANISGCAKTTGNATEVSKLVTYSGDINATSDHKVNALDLSLLVAQGVYGQTLCTTYSGSVSKTDINHDCKVNALDLSVMLADYGKSF